MFASWTYAELPLRPNPSHSRVPLRCAIIAARSCERPNRLSEGYQPLGTAKIGDFPAQQLSGALSRIAAAGFAVGCSEIDGETSRSDKIALATIRG